ncbi:rRNA maturation RNase YbeY [Butyrivibrio sp. YAB3001]|uniref:rRNA maturation RNase YbeY n=1 Tax=Butyrivibrio sp. YAB3001 TaxID=1520812 RepID=UPI0008F67811|nr:rRNA maturation RNase YbeY [Butyrivibrio sp. YAB3001]SFD02670.1 probable rRNA maturation factor [Butyrivibrio sp. YAB3001]
MTFCVENEVDAHFDFDPDDVARKVAEEVLKQEGCNFEVEINLLITDDDGIREMNSEFRQIDNPTDVLSFPNVSYETAGDFSVIEGEQKVDLINPDTGEVYFGDIVINENRVRSQASEYGHSEKREFAFLVAHSMLHLCGYDHMEADEAAVMEEKQNLVLNALGITRD